MSNTALAYYIVGIANVIAVTVIAVILIRWNN